jgi:calcyclin binding protein
MVSFEEVAKNPDEVLPSQERLRDAKELEALFPQLTSPTARMHLESLTKKLRRESEALERVGASKKTVEEKKEDVKDSAPAAPKPVPVAAVVAATAPPPSSGGYVSVDRFAFDAGEYGAQFVTLYVTLPGVGEIPRDQITCDFTTASFDLIVRDLKGKSCRLFRDNLEKDIVPEKSKIIVKADKVLIKLSKIKSEYGSYDFWTKLTDNKRKTKPDGTRKEADPQASIMQMMKDMYNDGDDNMRKVIGETMMKQQRGELDKPNNMDLDSMNMPDEQ